MNDLIYEFLERQEIVILGLCRNVSKQLSNDVTRLLNSFQDFSKIHFRFVESDSSDNTLEILAELEKVIPNFKYLTLGNLQAEIPERVARICYCRNVCIDLFHQDSELVNCTYVAVSDLDGANVLLTREAVLSCWERDDWDACMANQAAPYYDIYALRHKTWSPNDCWHYESELRASGVNPVSARNRAVYSRMLTIAPDSSWIQVDSAFGGLAIYKRHLFDRARYFSKLPSGKHVCEHVTLHEQMRKEGAKLFINPKLINLGWNTHSESKKFSKKVRRIMKLIIWKFVPSLRARLF